MASSEQREDGPQAQEIDKDYSDSVEELGLGAIDKALQELACVVTDPLDNSTTSRAEQEAASVACKKEEGKLDDASRRSSHSIHRSQQLAEPIVVEKSTPDPPKKIEKEADPPAPPAPEIVAPIPKKTMSEESKTVTFDVGGVAYKVSKALVAKYPDTKLASLVEESKESEDPIFIDRNGELFSYVLDYMRDQKAFLPLKVARGSVMQEYEYFGFTEVPPSSIVCSRANLEAALHVAACQKTYEEEMKKVLETMDQLEADKRYIEMAHRCYQGIVSTGTFDEVQIYNGRGQVLEEEAFNKHLSKYGLKHEANRQEGNYLYVEVARLEDE